MRPASYDWNFPLRRPHTGILLGNGTLGIMVWGEGNALQISMGRADLWDHRGGMPWTEKMSYARIRDCLERQDDAGLRNLFERTAHAPGEPERPSVIPVGRLNIQLPTGANLKTGTLDLEDGSVRLKVRHGRQIHTVDLHLDMQRATFMVRFPARWKGVVVQPIPAWNSLGQYLSSVSFPKPETFDGSVKGWFQAMPADPGSGVGYQQSGRMLCVAVPRAESCDSFVRQAGSILASMQKAARGPLQKANLAWWKSYWKTVPGIDIPNQRLSFLYWYGMYKFASFTNPRAVPASLQGPWIEDYQMPPWSSDYHFNINVQMCYQPAYHGNRLENLRPLFDMVLSWEPVLRHNAKLFLGIDDGIMLPHAVDDRCTCMGGFWTGSIDHGCTAWVACMMYRYYRYTMDRTFLRKAYPFMKGAMRVYEAMMERQEDRLVLPVTVSPEYRGANLDAWGQNASFQLACCHALIESLIASAGVLSESEPSAWRAIQRDLPRACVGGEGRDRMITLWEGTWLDESHRHHSHLSGITPFDVLPLDDPEWKPIIERSLAHWIFRGPGYWSGWCIPWASMIHSHVGNAEAAELYLDIFDRIYTNEGYGTLHDAATPGFTLMGIGSVGKHLNRPEIMQMDGGMGSVAAIQEMLLHTRRGVTHLFAGAPARWRHVAFSGMRTEGAFLISAARNHREVTNVRIQSLAGGIIKLANPTNGTIRMTRTVKGRKETAIIQGSVLEIAMSKTETVVLNPA
ncbi:MAG: hypothetical protein A2498_01025 [Lentisphaerae bacterium RIFOXYC12_FULL_60_16]|nr:MAG: hypothetical protein A2498_01025 [Lentisphaerae bacterium RIFOXYC12_FULL_60_16]OGV73087.1 MAG: hypothetical protein A2269_05975 [Lentisphaerae bacterium RIFOXYA12_FULL_60_10]